MTSARCPSLDWTTSTQFVAVVVVGDRRLVLSLAYVLGEWQVLSLVGSLVHSRLDGMILDDRSHKVIATCASPVDALQAAESYAAAWYLDQAGEGARAHG